MTFYAVVVGSLTITYNLALASFSWEDMLVGVLLSTALVAVYRNAISPETNPGAGYVVHLLVRLPRLLWMLGVDIVLGTWQVAKFVVGARKLDHPGIVKIPFGNHTSVRVGMVGLVVTMSPGSFLVDIDWVERAMLVHYIDASDPDRLRDDVNKYFRLWDYGDNDTAGRLKSREAI